MATKKENHKVISRIIRAREKAALRHGVEIKSDKMAVARRGWGVGKVIDAKNSDE